VFAKTKCEKIVGAEIEAEMEAKGWRYFFEKIRKADVKRIVAEESNELDESEAEDLLSYVSKTGYEYFQITGTGDFSGGFQELLIVDKACSIVKRELTYAE
jgi:hypothetical protein